MGYTSFLPYITVELQNITRSTLSLRQTIFTLMVEFNNDDKESKRRITRPKSVVFEISSLGTNP